jgi:hypothetical protein
VTVKGDGPVNITLIGIGVDSDVCVIEHSTGSVSVEWDAERSGSLNIAYLDNLGEAVLLLDQLQKAQYKVPYRLVHEMAINAISLLLEEKNDDNFEA